MKNIKLQESIKMLTYAEFSRDLEREDFSSSEIELIKSYCKRNKWNLNIDHDDLFEVNFEKRNVDYRIFIEKNFDEYYTIEIFCNYSQRRDLENNIEKWIMIDGSEYLREFLNKIEKFYLHRNFYNIDKIKF